MVSALHEGHRVAFFSTASIRKDTLPCISFPFCVEAALPITDPKDKRPAAPVASVRPRRENGVPSRRPRAFLRRDVFRELR